MTAKYCNRLSSFADVENDYDKTKPIRGKGRHAGKIPIASRKRAWEEIVKVNDDCYALYDSDVYWWFSEDDNYMKWVDHAAAGILWTRDRKKNTESVRIRNVGVGMNAFGRIDFLFRFLPMGLRVDNRNSHYYIYDVQSKYSHYLPKTTIHLQDDYTGDPEEMRTWRASNDIPTKYDDMDVTLTRTMNAVGRPEGEWQLTSKSHNQPRKRVDTEAKKAARHDIKSFLEYCWLRAPVLRDVTPTQWHTRNREAAELSGMLDVFDPLETIKEGSDERMTVCRLFFAMKSKSDFDDVWDAQKQEWVGTNTSFWDDPDTFRKRYNTFINKYCDFTYTTTDY